MTFSCYFKDVQCHGAGDRGFAETPASIAANRNQQHKGRESCITARIPSVLFTGGTQQSPEQHCPGCQHPQEHIAAKAREMEPELLSGSSQCLSEQAAVQSRDMPAASCTPGTGKRLGLGQVSQDEVGALRPAGRASLCTVAHKPLAVDFNPQYQ